MARERLKDASGSAVVVNEGESAAIELSFVDLNGDAIAKSAIDTLTVTLTNELDSSVINSRDDQSVLDANGGVLSSEGVLTLTLGALDNPIVAATPSGLETHFLDVNWTWVDGDGATQVGVHEFSFDVAPEGFGASGSTSTPATARRIPRPARSRRVDVLTFADAVDRVLMIEEVNPSETRAVQRARLSVQSALNSFASYSSSGFRYYDARHSFNASASIAIDSIVVSSNVVTPSSLSEPDWMDMAHLRVGGQSYPVISHNSYNFTVDGTLPDGTYTGAYIERMFYPLPSDFRRRGSFSDNDNYYPVIDVPGGVLQSWQDYYDWARSVANPRIFGAISSDQRFQGELMLAIWPPYTTSVRLNLFYERYPASCRVHRVGSGTITTSGTSVTATGSVFTDDHVGSVLVVGVGTDTDILNPLSSLDLVYDKRIITGFTSSTRVLLDKALSVDASGVTFYISDPIDVQPGTQQEAFLRLCEYEFCRQSRSKHVNERYQAFIEALNIAMADDSRYRAIMDDVDSLGDGMYMLGDIVGRPDLA